MPFPFPNTTVRNSCVQSDRTQGRSRAVCQRRLAFSDVFHSKCAAKPGPRTSLRRERPYAISVPNYPVDFGVTCSLGKA